MLGSHLFNGTNVTPENEEYMYSINKTEINKTWCNYIFMTYLESVWYCFFNIAFY